MLQPARSFSLCQRDVADLYKWVFWDSFLHLLVLELLHICRYFLTFRGHEKSIRARETKILVVHQYFRPYQQRIQFCSETKLKLCPFCGFGEEPALPRDLPSLQKFNFLKWSSLSIFSVWLFPLRHNSDSPVCTGLTNRISIVNLKSISKTCTCLLSSQCSSWRESYCAQTNMLCTR